MTTETDKNTGTEAETVGTSATGPRRKKEDLMSSRLQNLGGRMKTEKVSTPLQKVEPVDATPGPEEITPDQPAPAVVNVAVEPEPAITSADEARPVTPRKAGRPGKKTDKTAAPGPNSQQMTVWVDKALLKTAKLRALEDETTLKQIVEAALRKYLK